MKLFLSGGTGYIGSHTAVELLNANHEVVLCDNLSNSSEDVVKRIEKITGKKVKFYKVDIRDIESLREVFSKENIDTIIHFAGLKAVGESVEMPLEYYSNNLNTTMNLLQMMKEFSIKNFIFSSSATVYGEENKSPLKEEVGRGTPSNPYGWTKYMSEQIIEDFSNANKEMSLVILRYFNPTGAHESGLIGENPKGRPNNIMPVLTQVAIGKLEKLTIFGTDYDTPDGTCQRDFIHVVDLAKAHLLASEYATKNKGYEIFNVGTGKPFSVKELVNSFERVNSLKLNYDFGDRRPGDLASIWADSSKIMNRLNFKPIHDIDSMCKDSYNWQKNADKQIK